ncbi:hypothetical protein JX266_007352 [Neoarthrinium moseri]|uniref:uncharacterized protein n=1 Tax=Neoarthrinium moseri TaxID=1658444 RepID=UPI001FDD5AB4|nr:uncharacterized protein JN550_009255 [Neoarthrinium moseri]KAI1846455.1 hypothetical protein JX266_007352 [Neoarthrinium moseri]KAI1863976.1 hypothetical protein JN550_009255 [Neoarthrinium moseri]
MDTYTPEREAHDDSTPHMGTDGEGDGGPRPRGKPRECYICRTLVYPTYVEPTGLGQMLGRPPTRAYEDEDGRLICPCKCSGSTKWVHEGCIQQWRYTNIGSTNYRRCERCHYEYRFQRMDWAQRLRSPILAFALAVMIVALLIFLLGFIGDQVLGLWLDPAGTIYGALGGEVDDWELDLDLDASELGLDALDDDGWSLHFLKGLFSLGLVGMVKVIFLSPFQWWNIRATGMLSGGRRRGGTGRDRLENINLSMVLIGTITFFWMVWTATRKWTKQALDKASERLSNAQPDDDDDDDDVDDEHVGANAEGSGPDAAEPTEPSTGPTGAEKLDKDL